jgi:MFS family permease
MQAVAQGWLVLVLTGDPLWLGIVAAAQFGPVLVLGLFGGLIADGLPKRRTLIVTQTIAMVLAFVLFGLTATNSVHVVHIVVLALLLGVVNAVDMPTRQAFVVEMVGREEIGNAVALNSAVFNGARVVGPAIAGLTIAATDISVAFLVNGVSFSPSCSYRAMDVRKSPAALMARPTTIRGVVADMAEGLRYVRTTPLVLLPILTIGLVATFGMNFSVVVPALARDVLHVGAEGFGFLMAASGVGSFAVAMAIAFGRRSRPALIGLGAAALGAAELVLAGSGSFGISLVAMFVVGLGGIAMAATGNTTIQMTVPDHLRGRVMSVYTTVFAGSTPIGGLLTGVLASAISVPFAIAVGGAGSPWSGLRLRLVPADGARHGRPAGRDPGGRDRARRRAADRPQWPGAGRYGSRRSATSGSPVDCARLTGSRPSGSPDGGRAGEDPSPRLSRSARSEATPPIRSSIDTSSRPGWFGS